MDIKVVWGPPASGKTTYVKNNRSRNSITFDFDLLMQTISGLSPHEKNSNLIGYLLDFREQIIKRLKTEKRLDDAWVITTWVDDKFRDKFDGVIVEYILMDTPEDICLQRVDESDDRHVAAEEMKQVIKDWFLKYNEMYGERCNPMEKEIRYMPAEIRSDGEEAEKKVSGLGIVYDQWEELWPGYRERILKGAVKRDKVVKSFFNHEPSQVLSTTKSKPSLELNDTEKGLGYVSPIPPTSYGKDLEINLARNNVEGSSFAFSVPDDGSKRWEEDGVFYREIKKLTLYEIGPVTDPAYLKTSANLRTAEDIYKEFLAEKSQAADEAGEQEEKRKAGQAEAERERELQILDAEVI